MSSIWCVAPESDKVELAYVATNGDTHPFWIRVKRRLSVGEERKVQTAGWRGVTGSRKDKDSETEIKIDWKASTFARTAAYLIDWSLSDDKGVKLAVTVDVIEALHPDVYGLIEAAVETHVKAMQEEKKPQTGSVAP